MRWRSNRGNAASEWSEDQLDDSFNQLLSALSALCLCCTRKGGKKLSVIRCHGGLGRPSTPEGQVDISIIPRSSHILKWKITGATHALEIQWGPRRICCFHSRHNGSERRGPDSGAMTGPSSPKSSKDSGGYRAHGGYIDFI